MTEDERLWYSYLERGRPPKKRGGVVGALFTILFMLLMMGFFAVVIAMQFGWVPPLLLGPGMPQQGEQQTKPSVPAQGRQTQPVTNSQGGSAPVVVSAPLPDCSAVGDTRTACQWNDQPTEQPVATEEPTPAYMAACITAPGERPCWLPEGQAWSEPETVPETPVVLLPPTDSPPFVFSDSACAAWRPPLVLPEGCE